MSGRLDRYRPWFYAAAAYNLVWGGTVVLAPSALARLEGSDRHALAAWQAVGMLVLVYAPAYWWTARSPSQHAHLIVIAVLGKTLGPIGYAWACATGKLPLASLPIVVANDLIWLPSFCAYLRKAAQLHGGISALLAGHRPPGQHAATPDSRGIQKTHTR